MDIQDFPVEELFLVPSEDSVDEDGNKLFCVYSRRLDAVTFVDLADRQRLDAQGISTMASLPEDSAQ